MLSVLLTLFLAQHVLGGTQTSYYSYLGDGQVVPRMDTSAVARCRFTVSLNETGWNSLRVLTQSHEKKYDDDAQAYAAGYLEGYATYKYIRAHFTTLLKAFRDERQTEKWHYREGDFPEEIYDYVLTQWKWIEETAKADAEHSATWRRMLLSRRILEGMAAGVKAVSAETAKTIGFEQLLLLNYYADIETLLEEKVKPRDAAEAQPLPEDRTLHCSALVRAVGKDGAPAKELKDVVDVFFSHDTWTSYFQMNRMLKQVTMELSDAQAAHTVIMSSYPALLFSMDDYYVTSNELAILETTYHVFSDLRHDIPQQAVPTWMRTAAAVRFSRNAGEFHALFDFHNSGTYNNGFSILDRKALRAEPPAGSDLLVDVEQIPGTIRMQSFTERLLRDGWYPSLNTPNIDELYQAAGYPERTQDGDLYFAREGARFKIFQRDAPKVKDFEEFKKLMTYGDFPAEPLAGGENEHDPGSVILSRYDMRNEVIDVAGTPQLGKLVYGRFHARVLMGGLDSKCLKLSDLAQVKFDELGAPGMGFHAISSPTHGFSIDGKPAPAFDFSVLGMEIKDGKAVVVPDKYKDILEGSLLPRVWDFKWTEFHALGETGFRPDNVNGFLPLVISCVVVGLAAAVAALVVEIIFVRRRRGKKGDGALLANDN